MLDYGVIDTHVHLWDTVPPFDKRPNPFGVHGTPKEFLEACGSVKVDKIVHMEFGRGVDTFMPEIELMEKLAEEHPKLVAMVAWAPLSKGKNAAYDLDEIKKHPIVKGIRQAHFSDPDGMAYVKDDMIDGVRLLKQYGYGFVLGTSFNQNGGVIRFLDKIGEDIPLILDHMGKPPVQQKLFDVWAKDIEKMAQNKQLTMKISSIATEAADPNWTKEDIAPYIRHSIDVFGWDRVIYASDWPVSTRNSNPERQMATLLDILSDATPEQLHKLFVDNAAKYYNL
ncbi:MAG: hypothetical protein E7332_03280 [Clostridiales bacterium]|nr:hypothetical protein [Clostridiales bacterium]MBP3941295.1 amidohydrolase family protein [Christensenellaceae bacterium]MBR2222740.1 amidohydrolase family protein [Christensenellaceae bacterium]MBR3843105.1 amidohydrolase family protein [Christensenellaceae bacterium]